MTKHNSSETNTDGGARRAGATWIAATGATLLLAAMTVFTAVHWDRIPDTAKFGVLLALTGATLVVGDRSRAHLPATATALSHLGALLIPVDIGALDLKLHLPWQTLLIVEGATSLVCLAPLARRCRSVVLSAAASTAVIMLAGGVGATTGLPAPLLLAGVAALVLGTRRQDVHAGAWALAAGAAPIGALAAQLLSSEVGGAAGQGVVRDLGVIGVAWPISLAVAIVGATVLAILAHRHDRMWIALGAVSVAGAQGLTAWMSLSAPLATRLLALPALFVIVELAASAAARDRFWAQPVATVAAGAEALTVPIVAASTLLMLMSSVLGGEIRRPIVAISAGLVACGWVVGGVRRAAPRAAATIIVFCSTIAALWFAISSTSTIAIACVAGAFLAEASRLATAPGLLIAMPWAVAINAERPALALGVASAAALTATFTAVRSGASNTPTGLLVTSWALLTWIVGCVAVAGTTGRAAATAVFVVGAALLAPLLDSSDRRFGNVARIAVALTAGTMLGLSPRGIVLAGAVIIVAALIEAVRLRQSAFAFAVVAPLLQVEFALGRLAGWSLPLTGLAVCTFGVLLTGIARAASGAAQHAVAAAGASSMLAGFVAAASNRTTIGPALIIVGIAALGAGLSARTRWLAHGGGATTTLGVWTVLATGHVTTSEWYVIPVVVYLTVIGVLARRTSVAQDQRPNSWQAYTPAIVIAALSGIGERLDGGPAWHMLFAGAVGLAAIAIGGSRRLAGPLLTGTAVLAVAAGHESLDSARGVPTWFWLAAGGSALLLLAMALERSDTSPVEAGRRLVDIVGERFE